MKFIELFHEYEEHNSRYQKSLRNHRKAIRELKAKFPKRGKLLESYGTSISFFIIGCVSVFLSIRTFFGPNPRMSVIFGIVGIFCNYHYRKSIKTIEELQK